MGCISKSSEIYQDILWETSSKFDSIKLTYSMSLLKLKGTRSTVHFYDFYGFGKKGDIIQLIVLLSQLIVLRVQLSVLRVLHRRCAFFFSPLQGGSLVVNLQGGRTSTINFQCMNASFTIQDQTWDCKQPPSTPWPFTLHLSQSLSQHKSITHFKLNQLSAE